MKKEKCKVSAETVEGETRLIIFAYQRENKDVSYKLVLRCQITQGSLKEGDSIRVCRSPDFEAEIISIEQNCKPIKLAHNGMKVGILVEKPGIESFIKRFQKTARICNPHVVMA